MDTDPAQAIQRLFDAFNPVGAEVGGIARLAALLRTPQTTVSSWKQKGNLPHWRKHAILRIAYGHKIPLPQDVIDYLDEAHEITQPRGYPVAPGYQDTDTSKAAAKAISPAVPLLRTMVLEAITAAGTLGITADECAIRLRLSILSVRPRFTELKLLGKIRDSGERRRNAGGHNAIAWVLA